MNISAARPVRYVIDAIGVTDAMLCLAGNNNTCRRPPTWLPARQVPRAQCGTVWHSGPRILCDALVLALKTKTFAVLLVCTLWETNLKQDHSFNPTVFLTDHC